MRNLLISFIFGIALSEECKRFRREKNVAPSGQAVQSSTYNSFGSAENAIDGSRKNLFNLKTCILSQYEIGPWWRVDLQNYYRVSAVTIVPLAMWYSMIVGAEVRVGNSLIGNGNKNYMCGTVNATSSGSFPTVCCHGVVGRYVNVVIPDKPQYLVFCEVEVYAVPVTCVRFSGEKNVALKSKVSQSSVYEPLSLAMKAVDRNKDNIYSNGSCAHTRYDYNAWWRADLQASHIVSEVTVFNRRDCCHQRLQGAEIHLGDSVLNNGRDGYRCGIITYTAPGSVHTICCNGRKGRYLTITIPGRQEYLTLCEVEINGLPIPPCLPNYYTESNVALIGKATQSSTLDSLGVADHGINDNYSPHYFKSACTSTRKEARPWWRVELPGRYAITTVIVVNRGDCCPERLNGAQVRAGESQEDNGNVNPRCGTIANASRGTYHYFCCCGKKARYINIVLPGRSRVLSMCKVDVSGVPVAEDCPRIPGDKNVALRGEATQSSTYSGLGEAGNAVDGSWNAYLFQSSCTLTRYQQAPWWRVDLHGKYQVSAVLIRNRQDCCKNRLERAEVHLGSSLVNNGNSNYRCGIIQSTSLGSIHLICCGGQVGQYVNVVSPKTVFLTLCEVEVYGVPVPKCRRFRKEKNLALLALTSQSSTYEAAGQASHAIDGNRSPYYIMKSCTHTLYEVSPWWQADLRMSVHVSAIKVVNRRDCCHKRLVGAEVRLGNSLAANGNANYRCGVISVAWPGSVHTLCCNGRKGRYVNVVIPGKEKNILTLCEVEVYAVCPPKTCPRFWNETNVALKGAANQSSTFSPTGLASNAIDGNQNPNYFSWSCSHTQKNFGPWWRLDLKTRFRISWVLIVNRQDCCSERLEGAEVLIGDGLLEQTDENIWCGTVEKVSPGSIHKLCCYGIKARFVNIIIPNREEYLSLCEVEVYGVLPLHNLGESEQFLREQVIGSIQPSSADRPALPDSQNAVSSKSSIQRLVSALKPGSLEDHTPPRNEQDGQPR
nr:PREDICTED: uncharacterized protein LOC102686556 isoform X1 [Lepisosteus oculatus]